MLLINLMPNVVLSVLVSHNEQLCNCQWGSNYYVAVCTFLHFCYNFSLHLENNSNIDIINFEHRFVHKSYQYLQLIHCVIFFVTGNFCCCLCQFSNERKKLAKQKLWWDWNFLWRIVQCIHWNLPNICLELDWILQLALQCYEPHAAKAQLKWPWLLCRNRHGFHMTRMS